MDNTLIALAVLIGSCLIVWLVGKLIKRATGFDIFGSAGPGCFGKP